MRKYQKEYEAYMKQVTDSFINMQTETTSQMFIVEWSNGQSVQGAYRFLR